MDLTKLNSLDLWHDASSSQEEIDNTIEYLSELPLRDVETEQTDDWFTLTLKFNNPVEGDESEVGAQDLLTLLTPGYFGLRPDRIEVPDGSNLTVIKFQWETVEHAKKGR